MNEEPQQDKGPGEDLSKGTGCVLGGLATIAVSAVLGVLGLTVFGGEGGPAWIGWLVAIGLLAGLAWLFRRTPGFLLGIGLTLAIFAVVGTACAVVIFPRLG